jgi:F-type H+-transporting ATPase subunit epsilon
MHLKIVLPFQVFADVDHVLRIVAHTAQGFFGILPHRLDCVAALSPALFFYETQADGEIALALDEGVLVKTGPEVLVAVRNAVGEADLGKLSQAVERQILKLDEREKTVRSVLARLEGNLVRRFMEISRHE